MSLRWRTAAQSPHTSEPVTALLAARDPEGNIFLAGIHLWREGRWVDELSFEPFEGEFWWVYENELLQNLQAAMAGL